MLRITMLSANHQGKGNLLLFPRDTEVHREGPVQCRERLPWDTNLSQDNRPISRLGWIEGRNLQIEAAVTEGLA